MGGGPALAPAFVCSSSNPDGIGPQLTTSARVLRLRLRLRCSLIPLAIAPHSCGRSVSLPSPSPPHPLPLRSHPPLQTFIYIHTRAVLLCPCGISRHLVRRLFATMPSLLDSPPQIPAAGGAWGSLYGAVQEPAKQPRHVAVAPAAAAVVAKKPAAAYGGMRKKNLEMCTEALGCETGAVDAGNVVAGKGDGEVEAAHAAERKRRAREEAEEMEKRARRPLPPPLTTLAHGGASRVRMVHERRDGRLAVYAVRAAVVEAERSGGRLRMRLLPLPLLPCIAAAASQQEAREAEAEKEEADEEHDGVAKYVRGGRCMEVTEDAAAVAAARRGGKQWEPEHQAAAFWSPPHNPPLAIPLPSPSSNSPEDAAGNVSERHGHNLVQHTCGGSASSRG
ncbi:hypothetical protein HU200_024638 [Digitaria exilis]|uniref:FAF domain-containing protein n=1 Tax=Digitaria exilis TaxID=1010633 RepID=A0A835C7I9_9POAL|nr:hypothetical protein HU200_024638 [Digitaria exilis]